MTMGEMMDQIDKDCEVLLLRALADQEVVAFGEDGFGVHGKNDTPKYFTIEDISLEISADEDANFFGSVILHLSNYSARDVGHICSDKNFMFSIRELLKKQSIDQEALTYSDIDFQPENGVSLDINIDLLLDWA